MADDDEEENDEEEEVTDEASWSLLEPFWGLLVASRIL